MDTKIAEDIRANFNHFDRDANGKIDFFEFTELMDALDADLTIEQARLGFESLDSDDNHQIDFDEFFTWWSNR